MLLLIPLFLIWQWRVLGQMENDLGKARYDIEGLVKWRMSWGKSVSQFGDLHQFDTMPM
jgi:hypothetical protein